MSSGTDEAWLPMVGIIAVYGSANATWSFHAAGVLKLALSYMALQRL